MHCTFRRLWTARLCCNIRGVSSPGPLVRVSELRKSYGSRLVLDNVSFDVAAGEIVGLLGPNGAGKTTTLSILATLRNPDAGNVTIAGHDLRREPRAVRRRLGLAPQSIAIYPSLSAFQNVELFARIHGLTAAAARSATAAALEIVGLDERAHESAATLSGGMRRRVNLACAMVHRPEILLLDEPTVGVDPQSRERILQILRELAVSGIAVIYSTHYMEEVERLCDKVLLIDRGRLLAEGPVAELVSRAGSRHRMELALRGRPPADLYAGLTGVEPIVSGAGDDRVILMLADLGKVAEVLERARAAGFPAIEFNLHSPNLSDAFMTLTGRALRDYSENHG